MDKHEETLHILSVCHYVMAAMVAGLLIVMSVYLIYGIFGIVGGLAENASEMVFLGDMFLSLGMLSVFSLSILASTLLYTGRCLSQKRWYGFCFVMASIQCLLFPFGTFLGVMTIRALCRPEVKVKFGRG